MRHNNTNNSLGRKSAHRKAMLSNMAASLILHKRIKTTTAKAKALRGFIEPILTRSKEDSTNARRLAFNYLQDKYAVTELFKEVSPKIADRPGGYTRILKLGTRAGDAAEICYIELVDFNEGMLAVAGGAETKTGRRSRRGAKKKPEGEAPKKAKAPVEGKAEVKAGTRTGTKAATKTRAKKAEIKPESPKPSTESESKE
jgi:large subunit ribosomal protein L17